MKFIDDVVAGRVPLPMVPRVVERVLRVIRQPDSALSDAAEELEQDPVLSSRVLRMANSSHFGGRRSMASIGDAVGLIGFRALETLVVASGAMSAFTEVPSVNLRQFWLMATVTACSGRQIANRMRVDADTAYTAGLLQGVGHLILCQCHAAKALEAFPGYRSPWGQDLADIEQRAFGVSHPQVSAIWVDRIGMPAAVVEAVANSLGSQTLQTAQTPLLGRVVQLACSVADSVAKGSTVEEAVAAIDSALLSVLSLDDYVGGTDFATDFAELQTMPAPL
jgi:HD-like signal output (HDOD) protein